MIKYLSMHSLDLTSTEETVSMSIVHDVVIRSVRENKAGVSRS